MAVYKFKQLLHHLRIMAVLLNYTGWLIFTAFNILPWWLPAVLKVLFICISDSPLPLLPLLFLLYSFSFMGVPFLLAKLVSL